MKGKRLEKTRLWSLNRILLLLTLLFPLFLSGCWGYREIDETAHILLLGVDKGKENVLTLTAQIAVPRAMGIPGGQGGSSGSGEKKPTMTISVESRTILTGLDLINSVVERRSTLHHLKAIIFSEQLAQEGLDRYLAPLMRYPEFRRTIFLAVCRGSCEKVLKEFQPVMEANPSKFVELLLGSQRYVGFIPFAQIHHIYNDMKSKSIQPVALLVGLESKRQPSYQRVQGVPEGDFLAGDLPRKGGNKIEVMGSAVFRGAKMVGTLNGDETMILNMFRGWFQEGLFAFPDPARSNRFVILRISAERKPRIKVLLDHEGIPAIWVRVPLDAEIISIQSGINYEQPGRLKILEQELNRRMEERAGELVRKTQEEFRSDIFGFGFKARHLVATYPQWQKMDWPALYPQARVSVTFDTQIRRIGLMRKSSPIKSW